ncbi:ABC transporter substrate-binding protein [Actinokineospora enzanensis]|uniref:ABC transporter substrate-binding protein n=1 Tax=Actinokineospora enzanensis TaxID=155975 RepID=UPI000361EF3D|nr:ABC transporter substrate-binding protein [Actinokineospora enzanensis]
MGKHGLVVRISAAASALVLGVSGCGSESANPDSPSPPALAGVGPITLVTGKDFSGNLQHQLDEWNGQHPDQPVQLIELPENADAQRQQMVQNAQTRSDAYTVLNLDVVWTAEFAANQWVVQLPEAEFPLGSLVPATVDTARYFKRLYAVPMNSDGGLLYYRKDLLDAAGLTAPKTWSEMSADCAKVLPANPGVSCYAGQFEKYEGLTVNFAEAVHSAGGSVVGEDGKPTVNTEAARRGLSFLVDGVRTGEIPQKARTFKEEESRRAFQAGELLFQRQWPYQYAKAQATDGSSAVAGKFGVATLPGLSGPGVSSLGGHNLAVSAFAKNKRSGLELIKFLTGEQQQRANLEKTSQAPSWASLYDEPALVARFPYLTELKKSILGAKRRPAVVKYQEVSVAIQEAAYGAMSGTTGVDQALATLQGKLDALTR